MFVRTPLEPKKVIGLMLHWFGHGVNANIIADRFNGGTLSMHKYVILYFIQLCS
jgi:hypothetical protein